MVPGRKLSANVFLSARIRNTSFAVGNAGVDILAG